MFKNSDKITEEDLVAEDYLLDKNKQYYSDRILVLAKNDIVIVIGLAELDNPSFTIYTTYDGFGDGDSHGFGNGNGNGLNYGIEDNDDDGEGYGLGYGYSDGSGDHLVSGNNYNDMLISLITKNDLKYYIL